MSVPVLLTVLEATNGPTATQLLLDEHHKSCASYVEAAAFTQPQYDINTIEATQPTCTPTVRHFTVQLHSGLEPSEQVGLTGDSKALGEWQLEGAIVLRAQDHLHWSANVLLPACVNISYRYFIFAEDAFGRKHIRRWETQLQPRLLQPSNASCVHVDRFGEVTAGAWQVNRGWLNNESIVQLKFEREKMFRVIDIDQFDPEHVLIKVVPLSDDAESASLDTAEAGVSVEVVKMSYGQSELQPQASFGSSYTHGNVLIFHVTLPQPMQTGFALVFHTPDQQPMGKALIRAADLVGSEGVLELVVTEPEQHSTTKIAELTLPYLIVNSLADAVLDFRTTYAHHWPKSWPNLDVGHRGNGRSYRADAPPEIENTLASFMRAYEGYADMIELDVHLTSDGVPIIYHDFGIRTAPRGKNVTSAAQLQHVLIKDLTYEALKKARVFALIDNKPVEYPAHNAEPRAEHRIFPTLVDVFEGLPKTLGIDVEIKWPQRTAPGGVEARQTIDKNFFIDRILATVIKSGCGRALIFSSFDADICTMLRFKQNIFPVMFLTMGETKKWTPFMDLRTRNFEQAINNAQAFELAGTAPHAEDFLGSNGAEMLLQAHDLGQITVIWGDDCNSRERVQYFREIGATATCYDRTDLYMPADKHGSFFNSPKLQAEFEAQCRR